MPKTRKKNSKGISYYKKRADKSWSLYIRYRDGEQRPDGWYTECITCSNWYPLKSMQCGHFMSRRYNATRFSEENTNGQCYRDNVLFYGEQYKYALAIDLKYGNGTAKKLAKEAKEYHKFTVEELQEIIHDAKEAIAFYEKSSITKSI